MHWFAPGTNLVTCQMAQGRVLWLETKTHDNVSISIVNVHQATANRHDMRQKFTYLLGVMIDTA